MGAPFLNYDPDAGEPPPQAPAPTPTLADVANPAGIGVPAPLPSPVDDLRRGAFGDTGAANYDALVAAGQRRPYAGITGMAGVPVAPEGGLGGGTGGVPGDLMSLFGDVMMGAAGKPGAGADRAAAQQLQAQRQQTMQVQALAAAQNMVEGDRKLYEDLKGISPENRVDFIHEHFQTQGRPIPPSVARLIASNRVLALLTSPEEIARTAADPGRAWVVMNATKDGATFLRYVNGLQGDAAENERKVHEAEVSRVNAEGALPLKILQIQKALNEVGRQPSDPEQRTAHDAGMDWYRVGIPGLPGQKMWKALTPAEAAQMGAAAGAGAPTGAPAAPSGRMSANDYLTATTPGAAGGAAPIGRVSAADFATGPAPAAAPGAAAPAPGAPLARPLPPGATARIDPTRALGADQPRNLREQQIKAAGIKNLRDRGIEVNDANLQQEMMYLRAEEKATEAETTKMATRILDKQNAIAEGRGQLDEMRLAVARVGLAKTPEDAYMQPWEFVKKAIQRDPSYSTLQGFPAMMANLSRSLGGEKGVLTQPDIDRISKAFGVGWFDTQETYEARLGFVEAVMGRALKELEKAQRERREVRKIDNSDMKYGEDDTGGGRNARIPALSIGETPAP